MIKNYFDKISVEMIFERWSYIWRVPIQLNAVVHIPAQSTVSAASVSRTIIARESCRHACSQQRRKKLMTVVLTHLSETGKDSFG